jgi:hypothetical protein
MASKQNTSSITSSNAPDTLIDAQERVQAWLYAVYSTERVLPLSQADFHQRYFEWEVLPSPPASIVASGAVESSLSSEGGFRLPAFAAMLRSAMNLLLPRRARAASSGSASTDTDSSDATTFSWACRSPKQPRSLPAPSEAGEIGETGETSSGYEADVSSSSESDTPAWASAPSASNDETSDLDSEAQFIVDRVDNINRDHRERMRDLRARFESSSSEPASSPATPEPMPAPLDVQAVTEILAQVDCDFASASQTLYDQAHQGTNSRGEYRAEIARIEALNRERTALVAREYARLRGIWCEQARMFNSRGEYVAEMAEIAALDRVHRNATTTLPPPQ